MEYMEEYMRAGDSVCQNLCRMQGICVTRECTCSNTGYTG